MIHRFVDLLEEPVATPYWPIQVTQGSPLNLQSVWMIGDLATSVRLDPTLDVIDGASILSDPLLSPDETEVAYGWVQDPSGATPVRSRIYVAQADGSSRTLIVTDPDQPYSTQLNLSPHWSPDGTQLIFVSYGTTIDGDSEIKRVNRDGTGLTSLHTITTGRTFHCSYSPSGNYICFAIRPDGDASPAEIWVMEADGTNPTNIFTSSNYALTFAETAFPAWQRNADVLGFIDIDQTSPHTNVVYKVNADGTGLTTLLTDTGGFYATTHKLSWLSDDSALVLRKRTNGTSVFNATSWVLAFVDGSGGGATDTSVDVSSGSNTAQFWVAVTSFEAPRVFFRRSDGTIGSVLEDGTDERTDHTPTDHSPNAVQHGMFGRNAN